MADSCWSEGAGSVQYTTAVPYTVPALGSAVVYKQSVASLLSGRCASRADCFVVSFITPTGQVPPLAKCRWIHEGTVASAC